MSFWLNKEYQKVTPREFRHGWAYPSFSLKEKNAFQDRYENIQDFANTGGAGKRFCPWDHKLGYEIQTYKQEVGDCVGNGWAQACNWTQYVENLLGDSQPFRYVHASYSYGTSREVGNFQIRGDGSIGEWMVKAGMTMGNLPMDAQGVPAYSGQLSRLWGNRPGVPANMRSIAGPILIKEQVRVTSYEQLRACIIVSKCMCTIASTMGFNMRLQDRGGKSWFNGRDSWGHQMCLIGCDDTGEAGVFDLNSWGPNAHGPQLDGPQGGGWIPADVIDRRLKMQGTECYAIKTFDSFIERKINYKTIRK